MVKHKRLIKQVLWSGGMDSTYLVQKLLKEGNRVEAFYIDIKNNVEKGQRERAAIEKMLPFFNGKDFSFKRLVSIEMFDSSVRLRRAQLPFFIFGAMHLHGPVSLGVVKDEELTKEIPDVQAIVHTFNRFRDNPLIIEFPLLELSKAEIYRQIDPFLKQRITFCQNHGPDRSGEC